MELPEDSVTYLVYRGTHWHLGRILWLTGIWLQKWQRICTLRDVVRCSSPSREQVVSPPPPTAVIDEDSFISKIKIIKIAFSDSSGLQYVHLNIPKWE